MRSNIARGPVAGLLCLVLVCLALVGAPAAARADAWEDSMNAADWAMKQRQLTAAEQHFEAAIAAAKAPQLDEQRLATSLDRFGAFYHSQGKYAEAEPLYLEALEIRERTLGPDSPIVASSLNNVATLYQTQGKYAEAEPLYKRSLAINEKAAGPVHPQVAVGVNNLASLYQAEGRYAEAEPLFERALSIRATQLGSEQPRHHPEHDQPGPVL